MSSFYYEAIIPTAFNTKNYIKLEQCTAETQ